MGQHEGAGDPQTARVQPLAYEDRLEATLTVSRILTAGADHHSGLESAHGAHYAGVVPSRLNEI